MKLVYYPNKILETKCEPVIEFNEELSLILDGMKKIMLDNNGVGLAANQVGLNKRIIILQTTKKEIYEFINLEILEIDGETAMTEGCLSAPTVFLNIVRPASVMFQYQDRTGEVKKAMAEGIEARTIFHETDHLNGIFYFSKVNRQERKIAQSKLKKLLK